MSEKKCGTCRFWGDLASDDGSGCRPCSAVDYAGGPRVRFDIPVAPSEVMAKVVDGEGFDATLLTREDFGCVLHEEKE